MGLILFISLQTSFSAISDLISLHAHRRRRCLRKRRRARLGPFSWHKQETNQVGFQSSSPGPNPSVSPPPTTNENTHSHTPLDSPYRWCQEDFCPLFSPPTNPLPFDWNCCCSLPLIPASSYERTEQWGSLRWFSKLLLTSLDKMRTLNWGEKLSNP